MDITPENRDKIIALLREGTCPICGKSGFKVPLMHITKAHGMDRIELKNIIMVGVRNGFIDPEYRDQKSEHAKNNNYSSNFDGKRGIRDVQPENAKKLISAQAKKRYADGKSAINKGNPYVDSIAQANSKPVIKMGKDGIIERYKSITAAAEANGVSISAISNCLKGTSETCAGCKWIYDNTIIRRQLK